MIMQMKEDIKKEKQRQKQISDEIVSLKSVAQFDMMRTKGF